MKIVDDSPSVLTALDRPNSYIGRSVPRPNLARLTQGRAQYVSDVVLPRMAHVAFVRSPHAHARIKAHRRRRGEESAGRHRRGDRRGTGQGHHALGRRADASQGPQIGAAARHRGRPRLLGRRGGLRRGRAHAAPRPRTPANWSRSTTRNCRAVTDPETALDAADAGDPSVDSATISASSACTTPAIPTRASPRPTPWSRPRSCSAATPASPTSRAPSSPTGIPASAPDRLSGHAGAAHDAEPVRQASRRWRSIRCASSPRTSAARSASRCTPTPTRWRRWRCRSCSSGRSSSSPTGSRASSPTSTPATIASRRRSASRTTAPSPPGRSTTSPASAPTRSIRAPRGIEANQVVNLTGGPYTCPNYRARARVVFQNKNVMCQYRAVGHPIATAVTEGLVELAAAKIGMDPLEIRRRNLIADDAHPVAGAVRHQVRGAVAPRGAGASRRDDELRGAARRAGRSSASRASIAASALRASSR